MSNTAPSVERTEALPGETRHQTSGNGHTAFVPASQLEEMIQQRLREERARLEREAGIAETTHTHFRRPEERPFTKAQRPHTTVLFGGLTWKHERILQGSIAGLGYKVMPLPNADKQSFQLGKEYGNNGQCNPTYFTVGNLVQYLQTLEESGIKRQDLIDNYIFLTAEACLEMNLDFFLNLLNALNMGDIINEVAHQVRPFEAEAGETDAILDESI